MAFLLTRLHVTRTWADILRRSVADALFKDDCVGMAAQLAYYFFFSLFPALLFLIAIASYFPVAMLIDEIVGTLGYFAPAEVLAIVTDQIQKISGGEQGGLLTLGLLAALWTSSTAMTAIIDTVNRAYGLEEGRAWWRVRLNAIALTIAGALFVLVCFALVIVGPQLAEPLAQMLGFGATFAWGWKILEWPIVFVLASVGIAVIYYYAPDAEQEWVWLTPGAVFSTTLWLAASLGFRYYVTNVTHYTETYGAIGGVMVLLLWFYLSGFVLLLGAEMNAKIEHASTRGKDPGEKLAGQKHRITPAAMRAWIRRRRRRGERPPSAQEIRKTMD